MAEEYIVRGANMNCSNGSGLSKINLPKSHGVYAFQKPMIGYRDTKSMSNIPPFGICAVTQKACIPSPADKWQKARGSVVTNICFVTCGLGGVIRFVDSGQ